MRSVDNPFEGITVESLADSYDWPREALKFVEGEVDSLHVLGDCGMGKTTLLQQIRHRLAMEGEHAAYACVPLEGTLDLTLLQGDAVLLDETDRLGRRALHETLSKLWAAGQGAVLASHRDQRRAIRRAGFLPVVLKLRRVRSAEWLARALMDRVRAALGPAAEAYEPTEDARRALLRHSRGNVERLMQIGYEIFEDIDAPRAIQASDIETAAAHVDRATRLGEE